MTFYNFGFENGMTFRLNRKTFNLILNPFESNSFRVSHYKQKDYKWLMEKSTEKNDWKWENETK